MSQNKPKRTRPRRLPGDWDGQDLIERIIRVDHAGEFGAVRIYEGQLAVLRGTAAGDKIQEMADAEQRHLDRFDQLLVERRVRPTILSPLWHVAGYALGAATAAMGAKAAMACTVAVEEVIDTHYREQGERLDEREAELKAIIEEFRQDELEHRDTALAEGAADAPGYELLTGFIKAGSRAAIWLSTRL
ncbi:MAG: demethoxyubiquinone hydroxylase family protein [Alphaproteobacteria bacterium]|nr:demethoxyubiquinone hydroxylase family protein [Alphaproteobacteria bacterium]